MALFLAVKLTKRLLFGQRLRYTDSNLCAEDNVKPLEGLVVLDLTRFLAGPYCTLLLGGLGAEVIKIESPDGGEAHRNRAPFAGLQGASMSRQTDDDIGLMVLHRARNKKSVTLNLRKPEGTELFKQLVKKADIVVENFSPGTIDKMGLSCATLQEWNPRIILCSISGFGQEGPRRDWRAYDPIIQAASGINSVTGFPDHPPARCGAAISDTTAPLFAVIGILSAVQMREKTGQGEWVDTSMQDGTFFLLPDLIEHMAAGMMPKQRGNTHPGGVPFNVYRAKDGYVSICAVSARNWKSLLEALKREDLLDDPRFVNLQKRMEFRDDVDAIVQAWIEQHTVDEAVVYLQQHEVPAGPVLSPAELIKDEHLIERNMVVDVVHPKHGVLPGVKGFGMPIKFMGKSFGFDQPCPEVGQHNEEVYADLLEFDDARLRELKENGVI